MDAARAVMLAQLVATLVMVGVIWFVQVVHYPLMARLGRESFAGWQAANLVRTSWVVVPPMLIEAGCALLAPFLDTPVPRGELLLGLALLGGVWASTFLLQVPLHTRLEAGFDPLLHLRLVRTNLLRSALWSARGVLVVAWEVRFPGAFGD